MMLMNVDDTSQNLADESCFFDVQPERNNTSPCGPEPSIPSAEKTPAEKGGVADPIMTRGQNDLRRRDFQVRNPIWFVDDVLEILHGNFHGVFHIMFSYVFGVLCWSGIPAPFTFLTMETLKIWSDNHPTLDRHWVLLHRNWGQMFWEIHVISK